MKEIMLVDRNIKLRDAFDDDTKNILKFHSIKNY